MLATSFAGSFIAVAFGIGGGALTLAVMATLVPPAALIPTPWGDPDPGRIWAGRR